MAEDTTDVTRKNVIDFERQLRFQAEQAFIGALLAKSTLDLAQQDLKSFSEVVDLNRQRVAAGDLAQGDFYKISLQKLQFERDVSAAQVNLIQAKASLRQLMGFETHRRRLRDRRRSGVRARHTLNLEDLKQQALDSRPDVQAARAGVTLARDTVSLEHGNRAQNLDGDFSYSHTGPLNTVGAGVAINLPFTIAIRATSRTARSRSARRSRRKPPRGSRPSPTS